MCSPISSKSVDGEAFRAARVPRRRSGFDESEAARERLSEANGGAWRRVAIFRLAGFLGFPRGMPRSMPVWFVSSGEGWICTDLLGEWFDLLERSEM